MFDVLVVEPTSDSEENNRELSNFYIICFLFLQDVYSCIGDWGSRRSGCNECCCLCGLANLCHDIH